jgi:hypothetical protein
LTTKIGYLDFVGEFKNSQMILAREARGKNGSKVLLRMVFKNISANELDWSWGRSLDGGKSWQVVWPILLPAQELVGKKGRAPILAARRCSLTDNP